MIFIIYKFSAIFESFLRSYIFIIKLFMALLFLFLWLWFRYVYISKHSHHLLLLLHDHTELCVSHIIELHHLVPLRLKHLVLISRIIIIKVNFFISSSIQLVCLTSNYFIFIFIDIFQIDLDSFLLLYIFVSDYLDMFYILINILFDV